MLRKDFDQTYIMSAFACATADFQQLLSNVSTNVTSKVNIKKYMHF